MHLKYGFSGILSKYCFSNEGDNKIFKLLESIFFLFFIILNLFESFKYEHKIDVSLFLSSNSFLHFSRYWLTLSFLLLRNIFVIFFIFSKFFKVALFWFSTLFFWWIELFNLKELNLFKLIFGKGKIDGLFLYDNFFNINSLLIIEFFTIFLKSFLGAEWFFALFFSLFIESKIFIFPKISFLYCWSLFK